MIQVRGFGDLAKLPPSKTHRLEIDIESHNGWIYSLIDEDDFGVYLSTHTFYEKSGIGIDELKSYGFNVEVISYEQSEREGYIYDNELETYVLPILKEGNQYE